MDKIAVLSPVYQSEKLIKSTAESIYKIPWILVDNASADHTVDYAKKIVPSSIVFENTQKVDRTENWARAIDCFLKQTSYPWMKWLFAGDRLKIYAKEAITRAIQRFPEARLIIWQVDEHHGETTRLWKPPELTSAQLLLPEQSLFLAAKYGNWFGPPIAHALHREALETLDHFGSYPWVADMEICLKIAKKYPVAYIDEPIGEFVLSHRQFYQTQHGKAEPIFEEALLKLKAAAWYQEMTGNDIAASDLFSSIQFQAVKQLILRKDLNILKHIKNKCITLCKGKP